MDGFSHEMAMLFKKWEDAGSNNSNWEIAIPDKFYSLITSFTAFHKFGE